MNSPVLGHNHPDRQTQKRKPRSGDFRRQNQFLQRIVFSLLREKYTCYYVKHTTLRKTGRVFNTFISPHTSQVSLVIRRTSLPVASGETHQGEGIPLFCFSQSTSLHAVGVREQERDSGVPAVFLAPWPPSPIVWGPFL